MVKGKTDLDKLQGSWTIVTLEMDGAEMPAGAPGGSKIVVNGNKFTTMSMGATYNGTISVDPTKKPKSFDLKFTAGPEKGNTSLGIYELDKDHWRICLTVTGKTRPSAFATAPGSGLALETLRRDASTAAPAKNKRPVADVPFDPLRNCKVNGRWCHCC